MRFPSAAATPFGQVFELSTHLLAVEMHHRGADLHWLRNAFVVATIGGHRYAFNQTRCDLVAAPAIELAGRKDYARTLLRRAGVSVADGGSYRPTEQDAALRRAHEIGWPVAVKPAGGKKGNGVTVGVADPEAFEAAWQAAWGAAPGGAKVVVERQAVGSEARFLAVAGHTVAVAGRAPAHVIGDGHSTVGDLVNAKNALRAQNPHLSTRLIRQVGDLDLVPDAGERVIIDPSAPANFAAGGDSIDLTDDVHPSYLAVAAATQRAVPGLGVAGVDIIAADWSQPATPGNHIVVEVNSRPAIGAHHFPWEGKPRNVAEAIVDACLATRWAGEADEGIDDADDDWIDDLDDETPGAV